MIELLKDWVRDLVILVIFASLVEMLLPGGSLKKYVKLVMGFFIMLAVLNPLLSLLRADYQAFYPFETTPGQKVQQEIQKKGSNLQKHNEELARANLESQLEQQMRALILTQQEVTEAEVQVTASAGGMIKAIRVGLTLYEAAEASAPTSAITSVKNVEIRVGEPAQSGRTAGAGDTGQLKQVREKVQKLLGSWYNIKPEVIEFAE